MKKILYIVLACFSILSLPVRAEYGSGFYSTSAYRMERSVGISTSANASVRYGAVKEQGTFVNGHFQTTVNALDINGHSYAPGQTPSGGGYRPGQIRRVSGEDEDDDRETEDPFFDKVQPVGNIPWIFMLILSLGYFCFKLITRTRARSARVH